MAGRPRCRRPACGTAAAQVLTGVEAKGYSRPAAQADRRHISAWNRQPGSGEIARTKLAALEATIGGLAEHPRMHGRDPALGSRLLISQGDRILYEVIPDLRESALGGNVVVLRIYGPGQSGD